MAAVWGASVTLAIFATRDISGAQLNPAVTCALVANGMTPAEEAPWFIGAQCVGATLAGLANYIIFSAGIAAAEASQKIVRGSAASTAIYSGAFGMVPSAALVGPVGAFAAEVWMTAILVFAVFAFTDPKSSLPTDAAPVCIGATVASLITVFGPVTGCGMNPARDLGPRLVTLCAGWGGAALSSWWVYTLGPIAGGLLGGYAYTQHFSPLVPASSDADGAKDAA